MNDVIPANQVIRDQYGREILVSGHFDGRYLLWVIFEDMHGNPVDLPLSVWKAGCHTLYSHALDTYSLR